MKLSSDELHASREQALQRCRDEIKWYEDVKRNKRLAHYMFQAGVIILSGLTPILILIDQVPKPLQALPAAMAGILAAISGAFRVPESYALFAYTAEALKSELFKFETRTSKAYQAEVDEADADEYKALNRFVAKVEGIVMNEVDDWRQFVRSNGKDEDR